MSTHFADVLALIVAIVFGTMGTIAMKLSNGFKKIVPTLLLAAFYGISFSAMTFALEYFDLSVIYGIWSGVGTLLVFMFGVFYFDEVLSLRKFIYLMFIIVGVVGIHLGDYVIKS